MKDKKRFNPKPKLICFHQDECGEQTGLQLKKKLIYRFKNVRFDRIFYVPVNLL